MPETEVLPVTPPEASSQQMLSSVLSPYNVPSANLSPEVQKSMQQVAAEPNIKQFLPELQNTVSKIQSEIPAANAPEHKAEFAQLMQGIENGQMKPEDILAGVQKEVASQTDLPPEDRKTVTETLQTLQEQQRLPQESRSPEVVKGALQRIVSIGKIIFIAIAAIIGFGIFKGMKGISAGGGGGH